MRQLIIAFADQILAHKVRVLLRNSGIDSDEICTTAACVLRTIGRISGGGVVLCPARLPDMSAASLMELLPEDFDMLMVSSSRQQAIMDRPGLFVLTQPFQTSELAESVRQLLDTRQISYVPKIERVNSLSASTQRSQEEQKLIAQAKYLLMNRKKMSEPEAHRYLQKRSMESGMRLADLARSLLEIG